MISVNRTEQVTTVQVSGRFDFRCVKPFHALLVDAPREWVIDLKEVDYVDSAALGLLLLIRDQAGGDAGSVTLRGAHGHPRDVLLMAKFDQMFRIEP